MKKWGEHLYAPHLPEAIHRLRLRMLTCAGYSYLQRFQQHDQRLSDIDRAIEIWNKAVQILPEDSPDLPGQLDTLSTAYAQYFGATGKHKHLEKAITTLERGLKLAKPHSPEHLSLLNSLGSVVGLCYQVSGKVEDLDRAVHTYEQVVEHTPSSDQEFPQKLYNYVQALKTRYEQTKSLADLKRVVHVWEEIAEYTPDWSPFRPIYLHDYAEALMTLYKRTKDLDDLERCIKAWELAVHDTPKEDALYIPSRLGRIMAIRERVVADATFADLELMIEQMTQIIAELPADYDAQERLKCFWFLSESWKLRYKVTNELHDLEKSIEILERLMAEKKLHGLNYVTHLNMLVDALRRHYERANDEHSLSRLIGLYEQFIEPMKPGSCTHALGQHQLAVYLVMHAERNSAPSDLDQAITFFEQALAAAEQSDWSTPELLAVIRADIAKAQTKRDKMHDNGK